ncbi:unnamed protein product [Durusdinium trenchii]|uniref:Uncharacterized protein n=1 Tax=Durusdinium trenchii TaxID=1381693 RepID=A0ABP0QME8_9DINO
MQMRKQLVRHCWKNGFDLEGENVPCWLLQKPESERCDDVACSDPEKRHRRNPPADTPVACSQWFGIWRREIVGSRQQTPQFLCFSRLSSRLLVGITVEGLRPFRVNKWVISWNIVIW